MVRIIIGKNESTAQNQFEVNPKLQRTQASGNRQGFVRGTEIPPFKVIQNGIITLKNRSVPLNLEETPNKKRTVKFDKPSLQGVPRER